MLAEPHRAQQILWDRRVDYIVMCSGGSEQMEFSKLAPNGLAARLSRGEIPDFLEPVGLEPSAGLIAWRVRRTHAAP